MALHAATEDRSSRAVRRRFSWDVVDPQLIRDLLVATYDAAGRHADVERLAGLDEVRLRAQAAASLGRAPRARHTSVLVPVLVERWLPRLRKSELDALLRMVQLGLAGRARTARPRSKKEILTFLAGLSVTGNLSVQIRSAFLRAHQAEGEPVRGGVTRRGRRPGALVLTGKSAVERRMPFDHQVDAWKSLDHLAETAGDAGASGLLVLPTGAGKTFTVVAWLLRRLDKDPALRVLWLAGQRELVEQAARAFVDHAETLSPKTERLLRVVHGGANPASALADSDVDVICATRQSVIGRGFEAPARRRLEAFLSRPCIVVVDEAHHAVAPTYQQMLGFIRKMAPSSVLVGLTATPWPNGFGMTARLRQLFEILLADVHVRDLVHSGVLARPVFHSVDTGETVDVTPDELRQIVGGDVPPSVLRGLDRSRRNQLIVEHWTSEAEQWGKTLIFACDIEHADNLHRLFREAGAAASVVHTRAEVDRGDVLTRFRKMHGPSVLVSVGMLLEGVDLPDARTAFLARPTTSRILMRQMIGRVLRGEAGGGEPFAHIVDVRDKWNGDLDILSPVEIPDLPPGPVASTEGGAGEHRLPPVPDELTNEPVGEDILRRIEKAYAELLGTIPHPTGMTSTTLVGFHELGHLNVPVFEHTHDRWTELIRDEVDWTEADYRTPFELFDDLPVPRPVVSDIREVVKFCRSQRIAPPLVPLRSTLSARSVAQQILDAGAMTEQDKLGRLREIYESTLARSAYLSFQAFVEAVQPEIFRLSGVTESAHDPESPRLGASDARLPRLRRQPSRDLQLLFRRTVALGRELLENDDSECGHLLPHPSSRAWSGRGRR